MSTHRPAVLVLALSLLAGCVAPSSSTSSAGMPTPAAVTVQRLEALDAAGRFDEVLALVDAELSGTRNHEARARMELYCGKALIGVGRSQSGILALQRALGELRKPEGDSAREIRLALGDASMRAERFRDAAGHYEQALKGERLGRARREALYYAIYVALSEIGDPAADTWKQQILLFSEDTLAATEQRLLGRAPPPKLVAVVASPSSAPGGIPSDPRDLLPSIHPRADWGAAAIRGNYDAMTPITRATVHHSALDTSNSGSATAVASEIRQLQSNHQQKWADIGYHFLIDRSGGIWEGRNLRWQGAHEGSGLNQGAIGICVLGNFELGPPTASQLSALGQLLDTCRQRWGLSAADIKTHKEVRPEPTECPGWALQGWVDDYRRSLALTSLARQ
ncbi:MAG: N-acetylmuramoyl-L-alanine amidase [Planctomycetota bacterium]|jgi:tetratricopeptide (TPR) repeat protein